MKRKISIIMAMSLVGVFAVIATLGLMSLNQPTPVYAQVPGGSTVGATGGPMVKLSFNAPTGGLATTDTVIIRLPGFGYGSDAGNVDNYTLTGFGTTDPNVTTAGSTGGDDVTLTFTVPTAVSAGTAMSITIEDGAGVTAPTAEGMYTITVDIQQATAGISGIASMMVHVQNSVTFGNANIDDPSVAVATHAVLTEEDEDVASGEITVSFLTGNSDGDLSVDDNDTVTIQLENFQIPSGLSASDISIMDSDNSGGEMPAGVSVSGDMVELMVPDMDSGMLLTQAIAQGATVTVTFKAAAGIMNPMHGGMHSVKVHTSASSKPAEQMICYDMDASPPYTVLAGTPPACTAPAMMVPVKVAIAPTTPDITRVSLSNDISGMATGMTVRFITDAELNDGDPTTETSHSVMLKVEGFVLPDFFPPNTVKINGRNVEAPDVDRDNGTIELPMPSDIQATKAVAVSFLQSAGIMNPTLAAGVDSMDYAVMVKTSVEDDEYGSEMVTIMQAEEVPMVPPTGVEVMAEPNTAGSATKLTVRFTTGSGGALVPGDEITVMARSFGLPTSIDGTDVTVNGAPARSVAVSGDTIIVTLGAAVPANRTVSVVFKVGAGIENPAKAGTVDVSVKTTAEGMSASAKVAITEPPTAAEIVPVAVVPQAPGEDSRITLKFMAPMRLSSIENSEIIFRFHDNFEVTGGRIDVSKTTIQANSIFGGPEVDTPKASSVVNPTSATVTYETVDREPQIRLAVPDMADDEGDQHILPGAVVTVVFQQGSGIMNPTEAGSYFIDYGINDDTTLQELGDMVLPVVVALSGDGGKRGTSVTAVAKGVEGGEAVLFWLDRATAIAGGKVTNAPDGVYDSTTESVLCRATAESNDTATCVFEVANPPFSPGVDLWVNVQDSEGRRVGTLKGAASTGYDWVAIIDPEDSDKIGSFDEHPVSQAFVQLDARVEIQPSEVNIGDTVTVSMFDYAEGGTIEVIIGSVRLDLNAPGVEFRQRQVQGSGEQSFTFSIPATVGGTPIPLGKVRVDVNKTGLTGHDFKADTNITIAGANITLSQPSILGNQSLSISGSGFSGRGAGADRCIEQGDVLINNVPVEIIELEDSGQCRDKIELTSSGTFTLTVLLREEDGTIPDPLQTGGTHTVIITDTLGVEGRTTIEIPDRTLDVNPKTARPRTAVTVSGRNFVADNPDGSSVAVDLKYDCGGNVRRTVSAEPDSSGNFEETLRVPDDCGIPSTNTITATVVIDGEETTTETTTHDIPEAEVQVTPGQGAIGSEITVTGEGFRTFEGVSGIELGTKNVLGGRVFYTDRDGKLSIEGLIVPGIDPGTYALVVGVGEDEERTTASVNYTVIDEGLPQRAPEAIVEGLQPLGEKLVRVFRFNNATKTWEFYDPRPEFAEANTISQTFGGNVYWINITEDAEVVLGGKTRRLTCIEGDCWNQIVW